MPAGEDLDDGAYAEAQKAVKDEAEALTSWRTLEEMSNPSSIHQIHQDVCGLDRSIIANSSLAASLNVAYDFIEPFLAVSLGPNDIEEGAREELQSAEEMVLQLVPSSQPDQMGKKLSRRDSSAIKVVMTALIRARIKTGTSDEDILKMILRSQEDIGPLQIPLYHRIIAEAGRHSRLDLVTRLLQQAHSAWSATTDEWLLYAQARVWADDPQSINEEALAEYWKVLSTFKAAPPEAYWLVEGNERHQRMAAAHRMQADILHPPRYLFVFLLHCQSQSTSLKTSSGVNKAQTILQAMIAAGHEPADDVWLTLFKASPSLRTHLPELIDAAQTSDRPNAASRRDDRGNPLMALLQRRASMLAVRDVLRILRIMGLPFQPFKTRSPLHRSTAIQARSSHLTPEQQAETYATVADMFGQVGSPVRALFALQLIVELQSSNVQECCDRAIIAVMKGCVVLGQPAKALSFGLGVIEDGLPVPGQEGVEGVRVRVPVTHPLVSALLRVASTLPSSEESIEQARRIMTLMYDHNMRTSLETLRAVAAFVFAASGDEPSDAHATYVALNRLQALAQSSPVLAEEGEASRNSVFSDLPKSLPSRARRKLDTLLHQLKSMGIEERFQVTRRRRAWRQNQKALRAQQGSQDEQRAADWVRRDDLQGDLVHSSAADVSTAPAVPSRPRRRSRSHHDEDDFIDPALRRDMRRPLTSAGYAVRLRVYATIRCDHQSAAFVYRSMLKHGIRPSLLHVAPIVEGLASEGRLEEARNVARSAHQTLGLLITPRIAAAIMRGLIRLGRRGEARRELEQYHKDGGLVTDYLRSLLNRAPVLADAQHVEAVFADAREHGEPARVQDVDQAIRFFWKHHRFIAAQRLAVMALLTGTRHDWELKRLLLSHGNFLRKLQVRKGMESDAETDAGAGADSGALNQAELAGDEPQQTREDAAPTQSAHMSFGAIEDDHSERMARFAELLAANRAFHNGLHASRNGHMRIFSRQEQETSLPNIIEACALNREALHLMRSVHAPAKALERQQKHWYRNEVLKLILDVVSGKWSQATERQIARKQARRQVWLAASSAEKQKGERQADQGDVESVSLTARAEAVDSSEEHPHVEEPRLEQESESEGHSQAATDEESSQRSSDPLRSPSSAYWLPKDSPAVRRSTSLPSLRSRTISSPLGHIDRSDGLHQDFLMPNRSGFDHSVQHHHQHHHQHQHQQQHQSEAAVWTSVLDRSKRGGNNGD